MIGERFNFEDVFFRDLTVCVLDTLEGEVRWINKFSSGDRVVNVPFYYSMTGDERFLLDSFTDDVVSNNRYVDLNTDIIPRGHLTLTSYEIRADEFANPNVWLKMVVENEVEIKNMLTKVRAIPITVRYDLEIHLSSEIDTFKCSQAILDTLWLYRFMYFEYNFMNIDAVMTIPDASNITINREKNLTSDNTIKLVVSFDVQTYYPAFRKPKLPNVLPFEVGTDYPSKLLLVKVDLFKPNPEYFQESLATCLIIIMKPMSVGSTISISIDYPNPSFVLISSFTFTKSTSSEQAEELSDYINSDTIYSSENNGSTLKVTAPTGSGSEINGKVFIISGISDEISVNPFQGGDSVTSEARDPIYSEIHSITTSSDGGMILSVGSGSNVLGNYLSIDLRNCGLKIDISININGEFDFIKIVSGDDLCPPSTNEDTNLNQLLSNSYDTPVGTDFRDTRDTITLPKKTRWYSNLIRSRVNNRTVSKTPYQSQDVNNQSKLNSR